LEKADITSHLRLKWLEHTKRFEDCKVLNDLNEELQMDLGAGLYFGTDMCASGICMTQTLIWLHGNRMPMIVLHGEVRSEME
jgi:hypothetical protein